MTNGALDFDKLVKLVDAAIKCVGMNLGPVERAVLIVHAKTAVSQTPYPLREEQMIADMGGFTSEYAVDGESVRQLLAIGRRENMQWVGGHEYLISIMTRMMFSLMGRTDRAGRERAAAVFSLIGYAIRRQSP